MRKLLCFGCVVALFAAVSVASDRTIDAVLDRANNKVNLTFSPDGERMLLYVAYDAAERGETPSAWAEMECLGVISNGVTSYSYAIPEKWRQGVGSLRFFLAPIATSDKYDRRVEWVRSPDDSKAFVDSGIVPAPGIAVRTKFMIPSKKNAAGDDNGDVGVFGVSGRFAWATRSGGSSFVSYFTNPATGYAQGVGGAVSAGGDVPHSLEIGPEGILLDGTSRKLYTDESWNDEIPTPFVIDTTKTTTDTLYVMERRAANGASYKKGAIYIYSFDITTNGVPARQYVPCVKGGKVGLYDRVTDTVFYQNGGAALTAGPEWGPDRIADGTAGVVSAGVRVAREVTDMSVEDGSRLVLTVAGSYGKAVVYFARDVEDKGSVPSAWAEVRCGGVIPADATTFSYDVPAAWKTDASVVRAFLAPVVTNPKYDSLTEWTYSPKDDLAYIDSGIVPAPGIAVRTTFMMPSKTRAGSDNVDVGLFGVSGKFAWASQSSTAFVSYFTTSATSPGATAYFSGCGYGSTSGGGNKPHELVLDAKGVQLDGNRRKVFTDANFLTEFPTPFQTDPNVIATSSLVIMGRRAEGEVSCNKSGAVYIYSFDITTNGVPARRYLPCKKGGKAGLYDQVTDEVFYQYGGSALVAGPEWGLPTIADDAVVATSPLAVLTRTAEIVSVDRENNTVSLAFSGVSCDTLLFAVRDRRGDRGADVADWAECFFVGKVAAATNEMTCTTLPKRWLRGGGTIRFLLTKADEFPYDERLDYIASTAAGKQYFDTEIYPTTNTVFAMRITRVVTDFASWGAVGNNGYAMSAFAHSSGSGIAWCYFGLSDHYVNEAIFKDGEEITFSLRLGMSGLFINDMPEPAAGPFDGRTTFSESDASIFLFARNNKGKPQKHGLEFKIHGAKIWDGETPVRDFVPCLKGGKAVMYDRVSKRYFGDLNNVGFVAGAPIAPSPDEAPTLSWSETLDIPLSGILLIVR